MSHVLIVDDDGILRETLAREARAWGFEVDVEGSAEGALSLLRKRRIDVLVTDLRMKGLDGIDLIREAREVSPHTQTLLMSAFATARDHQLATEHGTVRVLCKPFTPGELRSAVAAALDSRKGYHGTVYGLSLVDMLQMFHLSRRTIALSLGGQPPGTIFFRNGELIHAAYGDIRGTAALRELLRAESGSIATAPLAEPAERTITAPFDHVLIESLRQLDEGHRERAAPTPLPLPSELDDSFDLEFSSQDRHSDVMLARVDEACKRAVAAVDGALALGVVDLETGMLLGVYNSSGFSRSLNEIVAAACVDMFRGSNLARVQRAIRAHRGASEDGAHYFEEIHITSAHNFHFMKTIKRGKAVAVLVTSKKTIVGMGWAQLKAVLPDIELQVP
ncbi:MAG: response regulator [Polyangiales bacterium]